MPNWCYNSVVVSAKTKAELEEFIKFAKQTHRAEYYEPFSDERKVEEHAVGVFWNFITPPEEIREEYFGRQPRYSDSLPVSDPNWWAQTEERKKVSRFWYDWNITNWGTKWDIIFDENNETTIEPTDNGYQMVWYFETAWSPALPVYDKMSEMYPNLDFEYEITEEGNHFVGKLQYRDGALVYDQIINNPTHEDYVSLDIPCLSCRFIDSEECYLLGGK
jgi:hypothetical protein